MVGHFPRGLFAALTLAAGQLLVSLPAAAQDSLTGTIVDLEGAPLANVRVTARLGTEQYSVYSDAGGHYVLPLDEGIGVAETSWGAVKAIYGSPAGERSAPVAESRPREDSRWIGPVEITLKLDDAYMTVVDSLASIDGAVLRNYAMVPRHWTTSLGSYTIADTAEWQNLGMGKWGGGEDYAFNGTFWLPRITGEPIRVYFSNEQNDWTAQNKLDTMAALQILSELGCAFVETQINGDEHLRMVKAAIYQCPAKTVIWSQQPPWYAVTHWSKVEVNSDTDYLPGLGKEIFYQSCQLGPNNHGGIYQNAAQPPVVKDIVSTSLMAGFIAQIANGRAHNDLVDMQYP